MQLYLNAGLLVRSNYSLERVSLLWVFMNEENERRDINNWSGWTHLGLVLEFVMGLKSVISYVITEQSQLNPPVPEDRHIRFYFIIER